MEPLVRAPMVVSPAADVTELFKVLALRMVAPFMLYVAPVGRLMTPVDEIVVVAVPPKYAGPYEEKIVVEAWPSVVRPVTESVPLCVAFAKAAVPVKVGEAVIAKVPEVGNVTLVEPVVVSVRELAPEVTRLPASVMVFAPLLTPVPPELPASAVPKVRTPVEEKLDVELPPKYAGPYEEKSVVDAIWNTDATVVEVAVNCGDSRLVPVLI